MNNRHTSSTSYVTWGKRCLPQVYPLTYSLTILRSLKFLTLSLSLFLVCDITIAKPYIPQSEMMVLDFLPSKLTSSRIERLESRLENWSDDNEKKEAVWESLINAYLLQTKSSGDMRYVSYAKNRLQHWLRETPESEKARLLNAQIQQYNHNFTQAIEELKFLLNDHPKNNQAWSLLANLQLLTGDHPAAKTSCRQLSATSSLADAIICHSNIMIRTGSLDKAYRLLDALMPTIDKMPVQKQRWLHTSMVQIAIQQNHETRADHTVERAIKLIKDDDVSDSYLSRLVVDYLILNNRLDEAFSLIKNNRHDSALMIRTAVLAKKRGDNTIFTVIKTALTQIFAAEKIRGQSRHLREQALFTLLLLNDPEEALNLAKQNWALQKEPEDARILMKSALLTNDSTALQRAQTRIKNSGLIDRRLDIAHLRVSLI